MMDRFRDVKAIVLSLLGIVLAIGAMVQGNVLLSLALMGATVLVVAAWMLGFWEALASPGYREAAAAVGIVAALAQLSGSPAADGCRQRAQGALMLDFMQMSMQTQIHQLSPAERSLIEEAAEACMLQPARDQIEATSASTKALYQSPSGLIVDTAVTAAKGKPKDAPKVCLDYYRELRAARPDLFLMFEREHACVLARS